MMQSFIFATGVAVASCGGTAIDDGVNPALAGSLPTGIGGATGSGGSVGVGGATESLSSDCSDECSARVLSCVCGGPGQNCPKSPDEALSVCDQVFNRIYGDIYRYKNSCGGISVVAERGTGYHFDAQLQLVGVQSTLFAPCQLGSVSGRFGKKCDRLETEQLVCSPLYP
ncbi:MAG: hypothetical protein SFV15_15420 [Polyangiaceae bacterium]|nr:hypothetical protein [Polyangiaceae bacterium]